MEGIQTLSDFEIPANTMYMLFSRILLLPLKCKSYVTKNVFSEWNNIVSLEDFINTRNSSVAEVYQVYRGMYRVTITCSINAETKIVTFTNRRYLG